MVSIPGGTFRMGSDDFYPEERPVHAVAVDSFSIDAHPVTNLDFARFVADTGYITDAERQPDPAHYPGVDPALLVPGSLVFQPTPGPVPLDDVRRWWSYVPDACWRRPEGPGSAIDTRALHPVVHVTHADAAAYAAWCGRALPTEAEWEYAARGGLDGAVYAWGDEPAPDGRWPANTWQGEFPWHNAGADGFAGTSPIGSFPPNGYGLFDVTGNVWEWTDDHFAPHRVSDPSRSCCIPRNPRVREPVHDDGTAVDAIARRVVKGGSFLCAPSYCLRYRPAARQGQAVDTSASHIGFRCVIRGAHTHV